MPPSWRARRCGRRGSGSLGSATSAPPAAFAGRRSHPSARNPEKEPKPQCNETGCCLNSVRERSSAFVCVPPAADGSKSRARRVHFGRVRALVDLGGTVSASVWWPHRPQERPRMRHPTSSSTSPVATWLGFMQLVATPSSATRSPHSRSSSSPCSAPSTPTTNDVAGCHGEPVEGRRRVSRRRDRHNQLLTDREK